LALLIVALTGCATLPSDYERTVSKAITNTQDTRLGQTVSGLTAYHPGQSAFYILNSGLEAFAVRGALAGAAERSIDLQYYIYKGDTTGKLLTYQLLKAADRGVRVRILLDDLGVSGLDTVLAALDSHPNFQVRLFNPFIRRNRKGLAFLTDFSRVNRRMHNKSYTVDNQVTIVGGRNIGNEYFQANPGINFTDLDLLAAGPVVPEISDAFDAFWNSDFAVPVYALDIGQPKAEDLNQVREVLRQHAEGMRESDYAVRLRETDFIKNMGNEKMPLYRGDALVKYDLPDKVATDPYDLSTHMGPRLRMIAEDTQHEMLISSPYFVPGKPGMELFHKLSEQGVRIRILTNSLAATDVGIVHAGYSRYRKPLLQEGVELYEVKPGVGSADAENEHRIGGSSGASLHAKVFVFDRRSVFVGSLNLDPRSLIQNTEIGILVESPELADQLTVLFENAFQTFTFQVRLRNNPYADRDSSLSEEVLEWVTEEDGQQVKFDRDPYVSIWRIMGIKLLSLLPIEDQL
jgi:putative cardiolipin synthase